jgi:Fungal cellulose binding domain
MRRGKYTFLSMLLRDMRASWHRRHDLRSRASSCMHRTRPDAYAMMADPTSWEEVSLEEEEAPGPSEADPQHTATPPADRLKEGEPDTIGPVETFLEASPSPDDSRIAVEPVQSTGVPSPVEGDALPGSASAAGGEEAEDVGGVGPDAGPPEPAVVAADEYYETFFAHGSDVPTGSNPHSAVPLRAEVDIHAYGRDVASELGVCETSAGCASSEAGAAGDQGAGALEVCAAAWGQCGGAAWTRAACCGAGWECVAQNERYSQCLPQQQEDGL